MKSNQKIDRFIAQSQNGNNVIKKPKNIATRTHFPYVSTPCSGKIKGLQGSDSFGRAVSSVVEHYLDTI
jgi:hypothetical protein